jgi:hypothetical protein
MGWFALWTTVATLQPSMVGDLVAVRRYGRRRLRTPRVRTVATVSRLPGVAPFAGAQAIRLRAPTVPAGRVARASLHRG